MAMHLSKIIVPGFSVWLFVEYSSTLCVYMMCILCKYCVLCMCVFVCEFGYLIYSTTLSKHLTQMYDQSKKLCAYDFNHAIFKNI